MANIRRALDVMREQGFSAFAVHLESEHWKEAFLHPREANGVLVQVAERGPEAVSAARFAGLTLEDVLSGNGPSGDGRPSP